MDHERPTPLSTAIVAVGVAVVAAAAVWQAPNANWDLALFGILLAFSIFSEIMSVETESKLKISGSLPRHGPGDGLPRRHARRR